MRPVEVRPVDESPWGPGLFFEQVPDATNLTLNIADLMRWVEQAWIACGPKEDDHAVAH